MRSRSGRSQKRRTDERHHDDYTRADLDDKAAADARDLHGPNVLVVRGRAAGGAQAEVVKNFHCVMLLLVGALVMLHRVLRAS